MTTFPAQSRISAAEVEAAARAIRGMPYDDKHRGGRTWDRMSDTARASYLETAEIALEAAAPIGAARMVRHIAMFVRDDDSGSFVHGDLCSYGPPGTCDCERGMLYRWLMAYADALEAQ